MTPKTIENSHFWQKGKYGVDPNTLFGIESREKHENKDLSVLEDKLQMLKPNDREYAMSTCLIFIEGLEARKEVV